MNRKQKKQLKILLQVEKETFDPLLNPDAIKNQEYIQRLAMTLATSMQRTQKEKGGMNEADTIEVVRALITAWESKEKLEKIK